MEEIKQKIEGIFSCTFITAIFTVVMLVCTAITVVSVNKNNETLRSMSDKVSSTSIGMGVCLDYILQSENSRNSIDKFMEDYKKLKKENEVLLDKVQFYREKYEKMP